MKHTSTLTSLARSKFHQRAGITHDYHLGNTQQRVQRPTERKCENHVCSLPTRNRIFQCHLHQRTRFDQNITIPQFPSSLQLEWQESKPLTLRLTSSASAIPNEYFFPSFMHDHIAASTSHSPSYTLINISAKNCHLIMLQWLGW